MAHVSYRGLALRGNLSLWPRFCKKHGDKDSMHRSGDSIWALARASQGADGSHQSGEVVPTGRGDKPPRTWTRCRKLLRMPGLNFSAVERGSALDSARTADRYDCAIRLALALPPAGTSLV
jgi:hypothetical protein